jgi:hypothetical protein
MACPLPHGTSLARTIMDAYCPIINEFGLYFIVGIVLIPIGISFTELGEKEPITGLDFLIFSLLIMLLIIVVPLLFHITIFFRDLGFYYPLFGYELFELSFFVPSVFLLLDYAKQLTGLMIGVKKE